MPPSFDNTAVELPDGTEVLVLLEGNVVHYRVTDADGEVLDDTTYTPEEARQQARTIREREARSWDTVFPEQAGPVLDVADALERAASAIDGGD